MAAQIQQMRETFNENEKFKLLDDKARLHKQLIDAEKLSQYKQEEILNQKLQNESLRQEIKQLESRISALTAAFDAAKFLGDWMETGSLVEVVYDNFGINIEPERVRLFRISDMPTRLYGNTAIINTSYQYETNNLWKRDESLIVSYIDEQTLAGELIAEYILDGVPVAKAIYRVTCRRSQ
jgi:vacuolar-type H+-ATPase subunit I/STV1